jgi:hypothetical protein
MKSVTLFFSKVWVWQLASPCHPLTNISIASLCSYHCGKCSWIFYIPYAFLFKVYKTWKFACISTGFDLYYYNLSSAF